MATDLTPVSTPTSPGGALLPAAARVVIRRGCFDVLDSVPSFRLPVNPGQVTVPAVSGGEPLRNECEHFLDCIGSGERPRSDGLHGLAVVRALAAISRSLDASGHCQTVARG